VMRSGTTEREFMRLSTFERTWARGGHWAFVALPPGKLPATATEAEVTAAAVAFERAAPPSAAERAYQTAQARRPESLTLAMGVGNARFAAGRLRDAASAFEQAARRHDSAAAWVNLAELRLALGERDAAERAARRAVARSEVEPRWRGAADGILAKVLASPAR
jgi:tetratricopeptide (TPR) repeat protein